MTDNLEAIVSFESQVRVANGLSATSLLLPELLQISRAMPDNVNGLDGNQAAQLANVFLKGMDICSELLPLAVSYELKMEALKRQESSKAILVRSVVAGYKTAIDRKEYANNDDIYLAAVKKHIEATMFRTLIEEKKQVFSKAHHLMKNIFSRDMENSGEVVRVDGDPAPKTWVQKSSSWIVND